MNGKQRLELLGITRENSSWKARLHINAMADQTFELFSANEENGDISIKYLELDGSVSFYEKSYQKPVVYEVTRLGTPIEKNGETIKYLRPKGAGARLYITPGIIQKFKEALPIDTLVITEGEFKAFSGYLNGLDIVGIGGIHVIKDRDTKKLFAEIPRIIQRCAVKNILILFDADCLDIEYSQTKDLFTRPNSFFSAVRNLREALKEFRTTTDIYFGHLHSNIVKVERPKGLDDLYIAQKGNEANVTKELLKLTEAEHYFKIQNITAMSVVKLKQYFGIMRWEDFAAKYNEELAERPFIYMGSTYEYSHGSDDGRDEVGYKLKIHIETINFYRVGTDWMKDIVQPNQYGVNIKKRTVWKKSSITEDFDKRIVEIILKHAKRYDAFCNVPDNTATFQKVVGSCLNLYAPPIHEPEEGTWNVIDGYLKHLFKNQYQDTYELALDYLTLLYRKPTQKLPILCLVSAEQKTGKSTFLFFLRRMFGDNATIIDARALVDRFNDDWVSKLIIGVDEGFIEKKESLERIKSIVTNEKIKLEGKFSNRQEIPFFGKVIITSNDEMDFLRLDGNDTRFWINKVPGYAKEDPNLLDRMEDEIPAFSSFLENREMSYLPESRLYFKPELYMTETRNQVISNSVSWTEKNMRLVIREMLLDFQIAELRLSLVDLQNVLKKSEMRNLQLFEVENILKKRWGLEPSASRRYKLPTWYGDGDKAAVDWKSSKGRYYTFTAAQFLTTKETSEMEFLPIPYEQDLEASIAPF